MREIRDNSISYYLSHHAAVLFGSCLITRFLSLLVDYGLPSFIAWLTWVGIAVKCLVIWSVWLLKTMPKHPTRLDWIYRWGILAIAIFGFVLGIL
ncbi:MAG: hypothetical protein QNJ47_04010 [Nostocaceae cyanobacterium]|nr:hypothetical protein [Nostocaceae cyanobacterium]